MARKAKSDIEENESTTIENNVDSDTSKVTIINKKLCGKRVMGIGEEAVQFDKNGIATVTGEEAKYFTKASKDFSVSKD